MMPLTTCIGMSLGGSRIVCKLHLNLLGMKVNASKQTQKRWCHAAHLLSSIRSYPPSYLLLSSSPASTPSLVFSTFIHSPILKFNSSVSVNTLLHFCAIISGEFDKHNQTEHTLTLLGSPDLPLVPFPPPSPSNLSVVIQKFSHSW